MSQYCSVVDLTTFGINATAVANIDPIVLNNQCIAASAICDGYLGGLGQLPLLKPYPQDLVVYSAWVAQFLTMGARGYNPNAGADEIIKDRYLMAIDWLNKVQRQAIQSAFKFTPVAPPHFQLPQVYTSPKRGY